jgi:ABC-type transporter MlaC component
MMLGRSLFGGSFATFLLIAAGAASLAQTPGTTNNAAPIAAKPAQEAVRPAKPAPAKIAAAKDTKKHEPAKKIAAHSKKPEAKKLAAASKREPKKVTAKKPVPTVKVAAAAPKPLPASYTITTTRNHVTYTETRMVPVSATPPAPAVKIATAPANPAPQAQSVAPPAAGHDEPPHATAAAMPGSGAATFVASFLREAFRIARSAGTTSLQRRAQLADLFSSKMDVSRIAGYTTSDELTGTTADFQQRFRTILISYLVETYYPRLELASDPSVKLETVAATPLTDGTSVVWTTFSKEGWGSQSVQWHLVAGNGSYKVVDIMTAGASVMQMERDTFQSVMRNGGLPELMAKLDARTKSLAMAATE